MNRNGFASGEPSPLPQVRQSQEKLFNEQKLKEMYDTKNELDKYIVIADESRKKREFHDKWIGDWKETFWVTLAITLMSALILWFGMAIYVDVKSPVPTVCNYFKYQNGCYKTEYQVGNHQAYTTEKIPCDQYEKKVKYGI